METTKTQTKVPGLMPRPRREATMEEMDSFKKWANEQAESRREREHEMRLKAWRMTHP
jgi:hypothetical protein